CNYEEALKWYEKAKAEGSAEAYKNIGRLYESGYGVTGNIIVFEAAKHYQQAVDKGYGEAQKDLDRLLGPAIHFYDLSKIGRLYEIGDGIKQDAVAAVKCYQRAIDKGCRESHEGLKRLSERLDINCDDLNKIGMMYAHADGTERNYEKAFQWYNKAKAKG